MNTLTNIVLFAPDEILGHIRQFKDIDALLLNSGIKRSILCMHHLLARQYFRKHWRTDE